jgi:hypothetical protein
MARGPILIFLFVALYLSAVTANWIKAGTSIVARSLQKFADIFSDGEKSSLSFGGRPGRIP